MSESTLIKPQKNEGLCTRQLAFVGAFLLPTAKLLEAPSLLAQHAKGDLLLPAFLHFLLEVGVLCVLLFASSRSEQTLFERLNAFLGKGARVFYGIYALYFLFISILPLLDLEKFTYAAFFDTAPTLFSFAFFFILSAFVCLKGGRALGRIADFSLFLFVAPFFALLLMALPESDFSHLLPIFGTDFEHTMSAFTHTLPHFSDAVLLLPLLGNLRYQKGDGKKIVGGYALGAGGVLLFLAVFFGVYSSIAPREHYAFSKIAQYFPILTTIGRIDLLFVYLITIVLLFYTCIPVQYAVELTSKSIGTRKKLLLSLLINLGLFAFVFYFNKYYDGVYAIYTEKLPLLFLVIADMLPLFLLFLPSYPSQSSTNFKRSITKDHTKKEKTHA